MGSCILLQIAQTTCWQECRLPLFVARSAGCFSRCCLYATMHVYEVCSQAHHRKPLHSRLTGCCCHHIISVA